MQIDFQRFDFFVFDCDGVILNSNIIKTNAFELSLSIYPEKKVKDFINYHKLNGGVSRFKKFEYFFSNILNKSDYQIELNEALTIYERKVWEGLTTCNLIPGIKDFLIFLKKNNKILYVNSGSEERELNRIFEERGLFNFFNKIMGSPSSKKENMIEILKREDKDSKGIFFGDAKIDKEVAIEFGLHFIFVSEFSEWKNYPIDMCVIKNFVNLEKN